MQITDRTPAFDAHAPTAWHALITGVTFSYGPLEARTLVRLPHAAMTQPTPDLAFGFVF